MNSSFCTLPLASARPLANWLMAIENKYNSDPVFRAKADAYVATEEALGAELENEEGWTFEDTDGALEQAVNQW